MRIDHILVGTSELEAGRRWVAEQLGLATVIGGRHLAWGTHNAIASLGPDCYLEVIAPDPEGDGATILGLTDLSEPRVVSFAVATDDLEGMVRAAAAAGVDLGEVSEGSRTTPAGDEVRWRVTDPGADRLDGIVPFGIDWGDTPHPASRLEDAGYRLTELLVEHPQPYAAREALTAVGMDHLLVRDADTVALLATVSTPDDDEVTLR